MAQKLSDAQKLTVKERKDLTMAFLELDADMDGKLSKEEVWAWLGSQEFEFTEKEKKGLFMMMDDDENGVITLDEFLNFTARMRQMFPTLRLSRGPSKQSKQREDAIKQLEEIFNELDKNRDGLLLREQVITALTDSGYNTDVEHLQRLMASLDVGNGQVNYARFLESYRLPPARDGSGVNR